MEADIAAEADAAYEAHLEEQHRETREWVDSLSDSEIDALRRRALYNHRAAMLEVQAARPIGTLPRSSAAWRWKAPMLGGRKSPESGAVRPAAAAGGNV